MKKLAQDVHFPHLERNILALWNERGLAQKGLLANKGKSPFVFYDGPPFATGLPHYGHILAGTLKDVVPRYWVMKGKYVERRWGWDCHGLPVEFEMEQKLGLSGTPDIYKFGVSNFNEACRENVLRYTKEWEEIIGRTGRWVDFKNNYRTMDTPFMESVWWVFKQLWDKGLIFEGHRVMHYSWRVSTPLSNFEASLNYKELQDPAITVRFKSTSQNKYFLAWTTTPWTLPSNLGLAVHPDQVYSEIKNKSSGEIYVLGKERLSAYYPSTKDYETRREILGKELEGETYTPLYPFFKNRSQSGAFRILLADYVTTTEGTGIVHTAPAFGEDDFQTCLKYSIPLVDPVDSDGSFTDAVPPYRGLNIKEADKEIIKDLKAAGAVVRHDTVTHNVAFCWRSETPLIYKAISTWFVRLEPLKALLVESNSATHWVPGHLRDGRFGKWLENAKDWNISRNRFWGTPLPIWRCEKQCGGAVCVGSITDLEKLCGSRPIDLHKHFVDDLTIPCPKCQKKMSRIPEVLDCWFESGAMPYGQAHYPFENKETFERSFPADFIAEGLDQTRGWFYTLSVLGNALFRKAPFKNVIVNGLVLAEDGKKMSKRQKNYPDPSYVLEQYGADALRAYLMTSPASHAEELRFSEAGVKEIVRSVLLPYWNAVGFFITYALADGWTVDGFIPEKPGHSQNDLDRWILSRLQSLIKSVDEKMAIYHLYEVVPEVLLFIDELTNWYIRLNRRRFWEEEKSETKEMAYQTLYFVLNEFTKILAPILPFVTEEVYQNLRQPDAPESVHLCRFPELNPSWIRADLETEMSLVEKVVSMGRVSRNNNKLKTRQPLRELLVITKNPNDKKSIERFQSIIAKELNVKKVGFTSDEGKWVSLSVKVNAKVLGPRLGTKMKEVLAGAKRISPEEVSLLERQGNILIAGEKVMKEEVTIERQPLQVGIIQNSGEVTIWLDNYLDESLIAEGIAREIVNRIQKLRKDLNFDVTDRIQLKYKCDSKIGDVIRSFTQYIMSETLAMSLDHTEKSLPWTSEQDIDGFHFKVKIDKC